MCKPVENYRCQICGFVCKNNQGLAQHSANSHAMSIIEYFYWFDPECLIYKNCAFCGKERSLENIMNRFNCKTCSKECDYDLRNSVKIDRYGDDYFVEWGRRVKDVAGIIPLPSSLDFWIARGFSKQEAIGKVSEHNRSVSPIHKEKYLRQGYSENEAEQKISAEQRKRSKRSVDYWKSRGFSEDDAVKEVSLSQDHTSLVYFVDKYGSEEGNRRYSDYVGKIKSTTVFSYMNLVNRGASREEAINKIKEMQTNAAKQRSKKINGGSLFEESMALVLDYLNLAYNRHKIYQVDKRYSGKNKFYIELDYFLKDWQIDIEMDGFHWHTGREQQEEDDNRDKFLDCLGIRVVRVEECTWKEMKKHEKINFVKEAVYEG